jgi:hypothetical protein
VHRAEVFVEMRLSAGRQLCSLDASILHRRSLLFASGNAQSAIVAL